MLLVQLDFAIATQSIQDWLHPGCKLDITPATVSHRKLVCVRGAPRILLARRTKRPRTLSTIARILKAAQAHVFNSGNLEAIETQVLMSCTLRNRSMPRKQRQRARAASTRKANSTLPKTLKTQIGILDDKPPLIRSHIEKILAAIACKCDR